MEIIAKKQFNFQFSSGRFKIIPLDSWKHSQYLEQTKVRESVKSFVSFFFQTVLLS